LSVGNLLRHELAVFNEVRFSDYNFILQQLLKITAGKTICPYIPMTPRWGHISGAENCSHLTNASEAALATASWPFQLLSTAVRPR